MDTVESLAEEDKINTEVDNSHVVIARPEQADVLQRQIVPSAVARNKSPFHVRYVPPRSIEQDTSESDSFSYSVFAFFLDVFSIVTYLADVGSDIWVAALYYQNGDWWWFGLSLAFVFFPCFIMGAYSIYQSYHDEDSCVQILFAIVVTAIPGGPVILYIWIIFQEIRVNNARHKQKKQDLYEETISCIVGLASLRLIEAFMEAAPQLILQLHIICSGYGSTKPVMVAVQWFSVGTSLGSLSWAVAAYYKSDRLAKGKANVSYYGMALMFMWRTFVIGARVSSLALFASSLPYGVFALTMGHLLIMDVWLMMQSTNYRLQSADCSTFISFLPLAFVHIFCDIFFKEGHTRLRYIFYYTLMYLENAGMLFAWYFMTRTAHLWYLYPAFGVVLGGFLIGVLFQVLYFLKFHPNNSVEDPEHLRIKPWVPCSELSCI